MSLLTAIAIGFVLLVVAYVVIGLAICRAAGLADERLEQDAKRRELADELRVEEELYGPGGGWRAP